jgi:hypothetical protein
MTTAIGIVLLFGFSTTAVANNKNGFSDESFNVPFRFEKFELSMNKYIELLAKDAGYKYRHLESTCLDEERAQSGLKHNEYTNMVGARLETVSQIFMHVAKFDTDFKSKQITLICNHTKDISKA